MGASPRHDLEGSDDPEALDWQAPSERACDGCPGGWYRSPFIESVLRYRRRQADAGSRIPNILLDRCDDELVLEAVELLEAFEDEWRSEYLSTVTARANPEGGGDG